MKRTANIGASITGMGFGTRYTIIIVMNPRNSIVIRKAPMLGCSVFSVPGRSIQNDVPLAQTVLGSSQVTRCSNLKTSPSAGAEMMALVLFVLSMAQVANAFRHEVAQQDSSHFCLQKCCSSKCSNRSYALPGDLARHVELHDCVVKLHEPQYHGKSGEAFCEENCTIFASEGAKTIQVLRKSGKGEQHCKPESPVDGLCEQQCCHAKCTEQTYELDGTWQFFQDCHFGVSSVSFLKTCLWLPEFVCCVSGTSARVYCLEGMFSCALGP